MTDFEIINQMHREKAESNGAPCDADSLLIVKGLSSPDDHVMLIMHFTYLGAEYEIKRSHSDAKDLEKLLDAVGEQMPTDLFEEASQLVNETHNLLHGVFYTNPVRNYSKIARQLITDLFETGIKWANDFVERIDLDDPETYGSPESKQEKADGNPPTPQREVGEMDDALKDELSKLLGDFE